MNAESQAQTDAEERAQSLQEIPELVAEAGEEDAQWSLPLRLWRRSRFNPSYRSKVKETMMKSYTLTQRIALAAGLLSLTLAISSAFADSWWVPNNSTPAIGADTGGYWIVNTKSRSGQQNSQRNMWFKEPTNNAAVQLSIMNSSSWSPTKLAQAIVKDTHVATITTGPIPTVIAGYNGVEYHAIMQYPTHVVNLTVRVAQIDASHAVAISILTTPEISSSVQQKLIELLGTIQVKE